LFHFYRRAGDSLGKIKTANGDIPKKMGRGRKPK